MTIICPTCEQEHALFYTVHPKGKTTLNYICNRVPREVPTDTIDPDGKHYLVEIRYGTAVREVPFEAGLDIPTQWSNKYKQEQREKSQSKLDI